MIIAAVLIPLPVPEAFDYEAPEGLTLAPGDHVAVPLGPGWCGVSCRRCARRPGPTVV